jgi:hypothetical protein
MLSPADITIASVIVIIIGGGVKWNIISWEAHHTYANYATSAAATARVVKQVAVDTYQ